MDGRTGGRFRARGRLRWVLGVFGGFLLGSGGGENGAASEPRTAGWAPGTAPARARMTFPSLTRVPVTSPCARGVWVGGTVGWGVWGVCAPGGRPGVAAAAVTIPPSFCAFSTGCRLSGDDRLPCEGSLCVSPSMFHVCCVLKKMMFAC